MHVILFSNLLINRFETGWSFIYTLVYFLNFYWGLNSIMVGVMNSMFWIEFWKLLRNTIKLEK